MKNRVKQVFACLLSILIVVVGITPMTNSVVNAETTTGLQFTSIKIVDSETGTVVADLLNGDTPKLKSGVTYALNVSYSVPSNLQFSNTYLNVRLGDGVYIKTLPGATFTEGPVASTGFESLVKTPTGTGTSPYGYPAAGSEQSRNGDLKYKSKVSLTNVSSVGEICFVVDEAYLNQDPNQILSNLFKLSLSTDSTNNIDAKSFNAISSQEYLYGFWINQATEVISKGGTTKTINTYNTGGKSLTRAGSKTTVQIVYPSDIEFVSLEEKGLYNTNGRVVSTTESGGFKTTTVEWDEPGSYSGGLSFYPHLKVPSDTTRPNGSTFDVVIKNFSKTIWNDSPNVGRTSKAQEAKMTVTIIDGNTPERITSHGLVDTMPNWSLKKNDTYNVRLGSLLLKNELSIPTQPKTIEFDIDNADTAIIRGVTIPYAQGMTYGTIHWTTADGRSGTADPSVIKPSGSVSALITNEALGLGINDSIKTLKVDLGPIPASYDGIRRMQDLLDTWNPNNKYVSDEYYGWSYIPAGIYGTWKKGTSADVVSTIKVYTTGQAPAATETFKVVGKSDKPRVVNGVGTINKTQINGGDSFKVSGRIDDANWDWNPLQEPVIYMIMPEGFEYSNLTVTNGTLSAPSYVGEFEKDGTKIKVWKYSIDIGDETRGQYQPNFTSKNMNISFDVKTDNTARVKTYHINDFLGITTKDFKDIDAVIKREKWDASNWNTNKYTATFGDKVNSGKDMVSLSEGPGIKITQAYAVSAKSELLIPDTGKSYVYDKTSEATKEATTPVLTKGDDAVLRITVRNNMTSQLDRTTLYVPLLKKDLNFGAGFMPDGKNDLPLELKKVEPTANFEVKYLKLKPGKTYPVNTAPQPADYDIVTDPADANMLMLVSNSAIAPGDGGRVDITYKAGNDLTPTYNEKKDVITPVLDYNIGGNTSTLTKEPAAVSFHVDAPVTRDITVKKLWQDHAGAAMAAPVTSVDVELLKDGAVVEEKQLTAANGWTATFDNLEKANAAGVDYAYTVREKGLDASNDIKLDGAWYRATTSGSMDAGFTVTNKKSLTFTPMIPATTKLTVSKEWSGLSQAKANEHAVTVKLFKNGVATSQVKVLDKNNNFKATFDNLPDTDAVNGVNTKNVYTVKEVDADGNVLNTGDKIKLGDKEFVVSYDGAKVKNTLVNPKIKLEGDKVWNDANDQDGIRPDEVTIKLFANGVDTGKTTKATKAGGWVYKFENLDKYDANGDEIVYSVVEIGVPGYTAEINGTTITNTHDPAKIDIPVKKIWNDDNDAKGKRPQSVHITLFADGVKADEVDLNAGDNWAHTFANMPKFKDGKLIKYTVKEDAVASYESKITGDETEFQVTNTYKEPVKPNGGNDPGKNGGKKGGKPNTFDDGGMALYSMMAGLSGLAFIAVSKKRKYSR